METSFFFLFECQGGEVEGSVKKKKKLPFVLGPEFAMARIPAPVNLRSG